MQYGTLNYNETSSPVRSVFESFECATCWRYFHDISQLTIFSRYFHDSRLLMQKTEMMQMTTFKYRENIVKISWKYPENILKISWKDRESWKYRENIVKILWKYRESWKDCCSAAQITTLDANDWNDACPRYWQFCRRDCFVMFFANWNSSTVVILFCQYSTVQYSTVQYCMSSCVCEQERERKKKRARKREWNSKRARKKTIWGREFERSTIEREAEREIFVARAIPEQFSSVCLGWELVLCYVSCENGVIEQKWFVCENCEKC